MISNPPTDTPPAPEPKKQLSHLSCFDKRLTCQVLCMYLRVSPLHLALIDKKHTQKAVVCVYIRIYGLK